MRCVLLSASLLSPLSSAWAQDNSVMPSQANMVQFSASGFKEVSQDWLTITLHTAKQGTDAKAVQNQIDQALHKATAIAKADAQGERMQVRTGDFRLRPIRSDKGAIKGTISGWEGSTELVLEGRDFARINATAAKLGPFAVKHVDFGLSRQAQRELEKEVQTMAIDRFKLRASEISKNFGFTTYIIKGVAISSADDAPEYRPRGPDFGIQVAAAPAPDAPLALEAGKSTVSVLVSGTIEMR